MIKRQFALLLFAIAFLSGCGKKKNSNSIQMAKNSFSRVDIPMSGDQVVPADDTVRSFFDQDIKEFVALDDQDNESGSDHDFAWVDGDKADEGFKTVYFDFNRHGVRTDQKEAVQYDVAQVQKTLQETKSNQKVSIVVEGHACHSAGSAAYNLALSEKRAKTVANQLTAAGLPKENIKVVGRGQDIPVAYGNREQQWKNRRVELHVVRS
jgi:peptidoglycan-associated lipoprotein